eukprot:6298972-Karenia_brevis.AAC.1
MDGGCASPRQVCSGLDAASQQAAGKGEDNTQDTDKQASSRERQHRKGTAPSREAGGSSSKT